MSSLFINPFQRPLGILGTVLPLGKLYFYQSGTLDEAPVYDEDGDAYAQPILADITGLFPNVYLDDTLIYRVRLETAAGVEVGDADGLGIPDFADAIAEAIAEIDAAAAALVKPPAAGEQGVINSTQNYGDTRRYGVTADGSTNWEVAYPARMQDIYDNAALGIPIQFSMNGAVGLFNTGMNLTNVINGPDGTPVHFIFDPGVEFAGLVHFVSSGSPAVDANISAITVGTTTTVTFAAAHGMAIGSTRYVDIAGVTGTIAGTINGVRRLLTPTTTTQATIALNTTGLAYTSGGVVSDSPIKINWTGEICTYNRFGAINLEGVGGGVRCKSDASIDLEGTAGLGIHVVAGKDLSFEYLITENCAGQDVSPNMHGAIAIDGSGANGPDGLYVDLMEVWDSRVNGIVATGKGSFGTARVRAYGNGVASTQLPDFGLEDCLGYDSKNMFFGALFGRGSWHGDLIDVNQEYGFSGRAFAIADVGFDRDQITWTDYDSAFTEDGIGYSISRIISRNPQNMGVMTGAFQPVSSHVSIGTVSFGVISDSNAMVTDPATRLERSLVWQGGGYLSIGRLEARNTKQASIFKSDGNSAAATSWNIGSIHVGDHKANLLWCLRPGHLSSITIQSRTTGVDSDSSLVFSTNGSAGAIVVDQVNALNPNGVDCPLIDWNSLRGSLSNVYALDYRYTSGPTIDLRCACAADNIFLRKTGSIVASTTGLRYNNAGANLTGVSTSNCFVEGYTLGVTSTGTPANSSIAAANCITGSNTTDSDLAVAKLSVNQGNVNWTV